MPATVIAERIGWERSLTVLKDRLRELRPLFMPPDPAQRTEQLGDVQAEAGDSTAALNLWHQALQILDDLHHPDAARLRRKIHEHSSRTCRLA